MGYGGDGGTRLVKRFLLGVCVGGGSAVRAYRVGLAQAGRCEIAAKKLACAPRGGVRRAEGSGEVRSFTR